VAVGLTVLVGIVVGLAGTFVEVAFGVVCAEEITTGTKIR